MNVSALPAVLLAAAFVAAVRVLFARGDGVRRDGALAIAAGVAVPAALLLAEVRPAFPLRASDDGWMWLVWLVPTAAAAGIVCALPRVPKAVRRGLPGMVAAAAVALLVTPVDGGVRVFVGVVGLMVLWDVFAIPAAEDRRRSLSASVAVAVAAAPAILFRGAHSYSLALVAAVVGAAVLACVLSFRHVVVALPRTVAGVAAVGFGGAIVAANAYQRAGGVDDFPGVSAAALAAAAVVGAGVPARFGRIGAPAAAAGAALALAAVSAWTSGTFDRYDAWW